MFIPEVSGTVKQIPVAEGQEVKKGTVLLVLDDSIQRATVEQLQSQAQAAFTLWNELKAEPRKETLDVNEAQVVAAQAALKTAQDALDKQQAAYDVNPKSISKDALDSAVNAVATAKANLDVACKQRDLTKAGAWIYDINNQERTYNALYKSYLSASALLAKYTLRAPKDGIVLAINPTAGSYVSGQGAYDTYTQGMDPVLVLGSSREHLNVRCYVDEILVPRIPDAGQDEGPNVGSRIHGQDPAAITSGRSPSYRPRSSFPISAWSAWTSACCPSFSGSRNPRT